MLEVFLTIFFKYLTTVIFEFKKKFVFIVFKWPHEAILLLIEEYNLRQEDFTSGKMSQKKIWSLIADKIKKHGYNVTGLQCFSKFSGLKRTYNGIKENNRRPRSGVWPYFSVSY